MCLKPLPTITSPETHKVGENDTLGPMFQVLLVNSEVHLDSLLFTTGHRFWHTDNRDKTPAGAVERTYEMRGPLVTQISCPRLYIQILMQDNCLVRYTDTHKHTHTHTKRKKKKKKVTLCS